MELVQILKKPIVTEKSLNRMKDNHYSFEVHSQATKFDVARAVGSLFNVTVYKVKMLNRKGKFRRVFRKRQMTQTADKKIAIVTIDPKQSIDIFSEFNTEAVEENVSDSKK